MLLSVNYHKRKNGDLFKLLEKPETLHLHQLQNYIPLYKRFFSLNESNYNSVNLNHHWHITNVARSNKGGEDEDNVEGGGRVLKCQLKSETQKKTAPVFFKTAPLLDPFKFLVGKLPEKDQLLQLPQLQSVAQTCPAKFLDTNNAAYVDSFFVYLSSQLLHGHRFQHGVDFYGSFLGIKQQFQVNVIDDLEYLVTSEYFNEHRGKLFEIEDYSEFFDEEEFQRLQRKAQQQQRKKTPLRFVMEGDSEGTEAVNLLLESEELDSEDPHPHAAAAVLGGEMELVAEQQPLAAAETTHRLSQGTQSSCSSRSSYTEEEDDHEEDGEDGEENSFIGESIEGEEEAAEELPDDDNDAEAPALEDELVLEEVHVPQTQSQTQQQQELRNRNEENADDYDEDLDGNCSDGSTFAEEQVMATIPQFPVQVICMEQCDSTLDALILENDLSDEEWFAALMQIIMMLLVYQKAFHFTHNDLHSNNVMYVETEKKFLWYQVGGAVYKVPTYGRLFKIIDYGRAIYKYQGQTFCSNSFSAEGDAYSQYNCEPYFNPKKPRLEPNYSFDLCRLACSLFDFVIEEREIAHITSPNDIVDNAVGKLIYEWCCDDKGLNVVYKHNGQDRYPNFKLYKMIARTVHAHTPQEQLKRPEFAQYVWKKGGSNNNNQPPNDLFNIDSLPCYV